MVESSLFLLVLVIIFSLIFDYINGFSDTANSIATCIATRALSVRSAVLMAATLNFIGAMVSTKVAATIGEGIVNPYDITQLVILTGVVGAISWGLITWFFSIPSSSSHSIIGGIIGAVVAHSRFSELKWFGIRKIILALVISPILGLVVSFGFMIVLLWFFRGYSLHNLNKNFRRLQVVTAAFVAFSHGMADAQKSMGVITMALLSSGYIRSFDVPFLVVLACALAMSLGAIFGGWRIIKTVGKDFVKLQPVHGFCVQASASLIISIAAFFGLPTSTTHIMTSSILGVGFSRRLSAINWKIAANILWAWGLTLPASGTLSFILYMFLQPYFKG